MFITGVFVSCDSLLDAPTKSSMDEQVIFSIPVLAEGALMGIHQSIAETNSYRGRFIPFYGLNTDIEIYNASENINDDRAMLTHYDPRVNSVQMNTANNVWGKMYEAIERANLAIRGLTLFGNVERNPELAQILGEALTLRAMIYNDLVKAWVMFLRVLNLSAPTPCMCLEPTEIQFTSEYFPIWNMPKP